MPMRCDGDTPIGAKLELNLTAFIDVLFILLLFFMVSTTFTQHYLPLQLPKAKTSAVAHISPQMTKLEISASGEVYISHIRYTEASLRKHFESLSTKQIVIRADQRCPVRFVVNTIDLARASGIPNVVIETEK